MCFEGAPGADDNKNDENIKLEDQEFRLKVPRDQVTESLNQWLLASLKVKAMIAA